MNIIAARACDCVAEEAAGKEHLLLADVVLLSVHSWPSLHGRSSRTFAMLDLSFWTLPFPSLDPR